MRVRNAASVFKALNGIICVYKPSCVSIRQVQDTIKTSICRDLNALPDRPLEKRIEILGATNAPLQVNVVPNYADDPRVCGPRYIDEDIDCSYATHLGLFSSGVLILGINEGTRLTYKINIARPTRGYKVHGVLGKATDTYFWNGKVVEKSMYNNVTREKMDQMVGTIQAIHQKAMYRLTGFHLQSQATYDLAAQGLIRPANSKIPVLYGIKCVHFDPPHFTLEIQAVNEYETYLWTLVHELGRMLHTSAHCTGVHCIRQGKFDLHMALLRKHWQLQHIINNMHQCKKLLEENQDILEPESATVTSF